MKYLKNIALILLTFFHIVQAHAEGFAAGTLIKMPSGYATIENITIGDQIVCCDAQQEYVEGTVIYVAKKSINQYVRLSIAQEYLCVALDQQLYDEGSDCWIEAESLKSGDVLYSKEIRIDLINEPIEVYLLSIAQYHNFLVTKTDMCAHNFIPLILGFSVAFGGGLELAGLSMGFAGLGGFLGYQWHKKNKQKHTLRIQPQFSGNGMMPEDPEEEKKRKRDEAREEYRPLTNKEARMEAENLGYRETKNHPCGYTHDRPVFTDGKQFISPDKYGHKGGVWKVFDNTGERIATTNIDLTILIGK